MVFIRNVRVEIVDLETGKFAMCWWEEVYFGGRVIQEKGIVLSRAQLETGKYFDYNIPYHVKREVMLKLGGKLPWLK